MFARTLLVTYTVNVTESTAEPADRPVPLAWLDSFCMRNFTNKAIFDDTLPIADGTMEAGLLVPIPELTAAMQAWFRRKGWLPATAALQIASSSPRASQEAS